MITELYLENFKGFAGKHTIPLRKFTLLYGPNSSGKSTIIDAARCIFSKWAEGRGISSLDFSGLRGTPLSFRDIVNNRSSSKHLGLGYGFESKYEESHRIDLIYQGVAQSKYDNVLSMINYLKNETPFNLCLDKKSVDYLGNFYSNMNIKNMNIKQAVISSLNQIQNPTQRMIILSFLNSQNFFELVDLPVYFEKGWKIDTYRLVGEPSLNNYIQEYIKPALQNTGLDEELRSSGFGLDWARVKSAASLHRWAIGETEQIRFLGYKSEAKSLPPDVGEGDDPSDIYYQCFPGLVGNDIMRDLLGSINSRTLRYYGPHRSSEFVFENGALNSMWGHKSRDLVNTVQVHDFGITLCNELLKEMNVPYRIAVKDGLDERINNQEIVLEEAHGGNKFKVSELGYGIGQMLPLVLELQQQFRGPAICCVEQPELHLHPRLQAGLVDVFLATNAIDRARGYFSKRALPEKDYLPQAVSDEMQKMVTAHGQWIIETHSEAIMHRFQRRIREGAVPLEDVMVLYIENFEGQGSVCTQLRMNEQGEFIDEWPGGFFEDDFDDIFGLDD